MAAKLPTMNQLLELTDIHEIKRLRDLFAQEEATVDAEILSILKDSAEFDREIRFIDNIGEYLDPIAQDAQRLEDSLRDVSKLADEVSYQVRQLDSLRERIVEATKRTNDIIDLKNCIDGVQMAMARDDYGAAAGFINRYLNFDKSILDPASVELIETAERNLKEIVKAKLDRAINEGAPEAVLKYCQIFKQLGLDQQAITKYVEHLTRVSQKDEQAIFVELDRAGKEAEQRSKSEKVSYAAAISQLLQRFQRRAKRQMVSLDHIFGRPGFATILTRMQTILNDQCSKLLESFVTEWQVELHVKSISKAASDKNNVVRALGFTTARPVASNEYKDPREFAPMLDQIVTASQSLEGHVRYVKAISLAPMKKETKEGEEKQVFELKKDMKAEIAELISQHEKEYRRSKINQRIHEILGWYIRLEQWYMEETIRQAIDEETLPDDGLTSAMVDEVFFVLQECCRRATLTYNVNTLCALLNLIDEQVSGVLLEALDTAAKEPSSVRAVVQSKASPQSIAVALNNLELSATYILRLKTETEAPLPRVFQEPSEITKISALLDELAMSEKRFRHVLQANIELLSEGVVPGVIQLFEGFAGLSYLLSEEQYSQYQINDPFMQGFISNMHAKLAPHKKLLSQGNFDSFLHVVARSVMETMEKTLLSKRVSHYGAQQFDRDVRLLAGYFTDQTHGGRSVRDKFIRMTQISFVLGLDSEIEVLDYWGEKMNGGMAWRLTPVEVKKILSLRAEFKPDAISRLKL